MSVDTIKDTEELKENVGSAGDSGPTNGNDDNDNSENSDKEDDAGAMTPHRLIVRKQRYASKLLKKRIAAKDVPVAQVFLPVETSWRIHKNNSISGMVTRIFFYFHIFSILDEFFDVKTQWSNYR